MKKSLDNAIPRMLSEIAIKRAWEKTKPGEIDDSDFGILNKEDTKECLFGYTIEREENIYSARSYVTIPNLLMLQDANNKYTKLIKKYNLRFVPYTNDLTGQIFEKDNFATIEILADESNKNRRNLTILQPIETSSFREYKSWIKGLVNSTLGMTSLSDHN